MNDILNFRWRQANQGFKIVARPRLCKFKLAKVTTRDSIRLNKHFEFIFAWPQIPTGTCILRLSSSSSSLVIIHSFSDVIQFRIFDTKEKQQTCPRVTALLSVGCDS